MVEWEVLHKSKEGCLGHVTEQHNVEMEGWKEIKQVPLGIGNIVRKEGEALYTIFFRKAMMTFATYLHNLLGLESPAFVSNGAAIVESTVAARVPPIIQVAQ
jgi:hypothetical protein